jgi:pimeloyl-ACP methyl ester carboxylesterase
MNWIKLMTMRAYFNLVSIPFPVQTARTALKLFLTPPKHPTPQRELAVLDKAKLSHINFANEQLRVLQWGQGEDCVLLVHGWGGRGSQFHGFVEPLTQAGFKVIAFDGPAHGQSRKSRTDMLEFSEALQHIAGTLGPVHTIIGHSFGAACAVLAAHNGLAVEQLILIAAPKDAVTASELYAKMLRLPSRVTKMMRAQFVKLYRTNLVWEDLSLVKMLKVVNLKTLIIHDINDKEVPYCNYSELLTASPGVQMYTTDGLGHRRILRDATVVSYCLDYIRSSASKAKANRLPSEQVRHAANDIFA